MPGLNSEPVETGTANTVSPCRENRFVPDVISTYSPSGVQMGILSRPPPKQRPFRPFPIHPHQLSKPVEIWRPARSGLVDESTVVGNGEVRTEAATHLDALDNGNRASFGFRESAPAKKGILVE